MDPILGHGLKFWKMRYQLMIYVLKIQTSSCCYMQNWSVNDGCYGRKTNNEEKSKFNDHLEMISLELDGSYPWSRIEVLENALSIDDICFDGVHPNNCGIKNLVENIRHYKITHNLPASQNTVQPRKLHRNLNFA